MRHSTNIKINYYYYCHLKNKIPSSCLPFKPSPMQPHPILLTLSPIASPNPSLAMVSTFLLLSQYFPASRLRLSSPSSLKPSFLTSVAGYFWSYHLLRPYSMSGTVLEMWCIISFNSWKVGVTFTLNFLFVLDK